MVDQKPLEGPDLAAEGLALPDLADGAMVLGHVGEDQVLVVRREDDIFAVSAKRTH